MHIKFDTEGENRYIDFEIYYEHANTWEDLFMMIIGATIYRRRIWTCVNCIYPW